MGYYIKLLAKYPEAKKTEHDNDSSVEIFETGNRSTKPPGKESKKEFDNFVEENEGKAEGEKDKGMTFSQKISAKYL